MMRFDRFTERAQEAAQRAAEIIQRYGHNQIDTEHILLALIEQPQGVIPQILEFLKVDAAALIERLDYILRTSPKANDGKPCCHTSSIREPFDKHRYRGDIPYTKASPAKNTIGKVEKQF